jgi:aspartyl-tRNA(Asn)/glutamyl-tRNA(Gln) amidotransferase subunit A
LRQGFDRGLLHGIPLGIKDVIDVQEWPTAAGSPRWANSVARHDAPVVQRLRQAGAVLMGKTVTTPYASFDPSPTRNPWNLGRTPGGSSSGSAVAVACGMCLGSLGTQTGGSITRPASYCGVASIKPTFGRVSAQGVVPLATSMDHVGALAGCIRDLGLLLQAIAGPADNASTQEPVPDWSCERALPPMLPRIGRLHGLFDRLASPSVRQFVDSASEALKEKGATLQDVSLPASFAEVLPRHRLVMGVEAAAYHERRLRRYPEEYGPNIRKLLEEGLACPAPEYARCKEHQVQLREAMYGCFHGVEVLLSPATTTPAPDAATTGDPAFNSPWSYTGLPTVSFRGGRCPEGMPLAIQLIGPPWREGALLAAAAWCEEALGIKSEEPHLRDA